MEAGVSFTRLLRARRTRRMTSSTNYLLIRQLNMANKNLGGVFDSRILEVRLDTFGFALEFA
jgi:hypothetical protein